MNTINDVHQQFASFFNSATLEPFAYLVSKKLSEGHICLDLADAEVEDFPNLSEEKLVTTSTSGMKQPFILHNNRLYFQRYFNYETLILQRLQEFIEAEKQLESVRLNALQQESAFIKALFKPIHHPIENTKTDWQLVAAVSAVLNNFTIITGGPGTGKTTTVAKILSILFKVNPKLKVALAAPTGKAAARMAESLKETSAKFDQEVARNIQGLDPKTIHRLLGSIKDSPHFRHNKQNPLHYDVVIIDESSMIGVALFAKLLDAIGPETRLIMLGDKDQLASVEAGSLFGDLCQSQTQLNIFSSLRSALMNELNGNLPMPRSAEVDGQANHPLFQHVIELKVSHRFTSDGGIGKLSRAIIQNDVSVLQDFMETNADVQVVIDQVYSKQLFEKVVDGYREFIQEPDIKTALMKLNNLRVLCAIREGEQGLHATNRKIEKYLSDKGLISLKGDFYINRPIIITSNNYALGLFNGDVGMIRPDEKGVLKAWFEDSQGNLKALTPGLITQVETVFAMTIHKSQGSEFNQVFVVLPQTENIAILTRELLYTAVTRAKSKVFIQGTKAVIVKTADGQVQRASGIAQRFFTH